MVEVAPLEVMVSVEAVTPVEASVADGAARVTTAEAVTARAARLARQA